MPNRPIQYYNRYTQTVETEEIYGERSIRWAYTTKTGNFLINFIAKTPLVSKAYGYLMDLPSSKNKINPFIEKYKIDTQEFEKNEFTSFNDFFYRKLKPTARPISPSPNAIFPADGRHFGFQNISKMEGVFVKNQKFNLEALLGSRTLANQYQDGTLVLSRLCPTDYHRFHFPVEGLPTAAKCINGDLHSVNPLALRRKLKIFWENKRDLTIIESEIYGRVIMIEVGAICVGSIIQTYIPNHKISKGGEKGYFRFGGSSTILLFQKNKIKLTDDLTTNSLQNRELYAHVGDYLGHPY